MGASATSYRQTSPHMLELDIVFSARAQMCRRRCPVYRGWPSVVVGLFNHPRSPWTPRHPSPRISLSHTHSAPPPSMCWVGVHTFARDGIISGGVNPSSAAAAGGGRAAAGGAREACPTESATSAATPVAVASSGTVTGTVSCCVAFAASADACVSASTPSIPV